MLVRFARRADAAAIFAVHAAAFPTEAEARLVEMLIADDDDLVSLVAEQEGEIIGHVMFSWMDVDADGEPWTAAGLAPVAVLPSLQGKGVGSALITGGINRLAALGIEATFVLGHADYYPRFGYRAELAAPFASPFSGPHFMALYLDSSLTLPQRGKAEYAPAFARMD